MSELGHPLMEIAAPKTNERHPAFRPAHILVRTLCVFNISYWWAGEIFKPLGPWLANGMLGNLLLWWAVTSIVLLPVFVGVEAIWMLRYVAERRSIWIDVAFVASWILAFCAGVWYALTHYAIL